MPLMLYVPGPVGGHVGPPGGGVAESGLPNRGVSVENQTLESDTLMAYTVTGGAKSDG